MSRKTLKKSDFWYDLPKELIAQEPTEPRDQSRLFVYDRRSKQVEHKNFFDIAGYLRSGDLLVVNNTKVMPARLLGQKKITGGKVEVFLLKKVETQASNERWQVLLGGRVNVGLEIELSSNLSGKVLANHNDGTWLVEFNMSDKSLQDEIAKIGHIPLPPYIRSGMDKETDKEYYQTVFARPSENSSVAAPTAGLHFTQALLDKIKEQGVEIGELTLHVGIGTFSPVKTENVADHRMHSEYYELDETLIEKIIKTRQRGGRIFAVGTTSARTLETVADKLLKSSLEKISSLTGWTDIFIYPGYKFRLVDGLVTNFHLPESTLLMLLAAFLEQTGGVDGVELEKSLYSEAVAQRYRFFSYGDAMLIL